MPLVICLGATHLSLFLAGKMSLGCCTGAGGIRALSEKEDKEGGWGQAEADILHSVMEHNLETLASCSPQLPVIFI